MGFSFSAIATSDTFNRNEMESFSVRFFCNKLQFDKEVFLEEAMCLNYDDTYIDVLFLQKGTLIFTSNTDTSILLRTKYNSFRGKAGSFAVDERTMLFMTEYYEDCELKKDLVEQDGDRKVNKGNLNLEYEDGLDLTIKLIELITGESFYAHAADTRLYRYRLTNDKPQINEDDKLWLAYLSAKKIAVKTETTQIEVNPGSNSSVQNKTETGPITQERVLTWLKEMMLPVLEPAGFKPNASAKKYTYTDKECVQAITLSFSNYQHVGYTPYLSFEHKDKKFEKEFKLFWEKIGFEYKSTETCFGFLGKLHFAKPKPGGVFEDELGYKTFLTIKNKQDAKGVFETFHAFFKADLYPSLLKLRDPLNYLNLIHPKSHNDSSSQRTREHFWFWRDGLKNERLFRKYFYLKKYFPEELDKERLYYFETTKARGWTVSDEFIARHDELFEKIKDFQ